MIPLYGHGTHALTRSGLRAVQPGSQVGPMYCRWEGEGHSSRTALVALASRRSRARSHRRVVTRQLGRISGALIIHVHAGPLY